jgi:hypothetical protein
MASVEIPIAPNSRPDSDWISDLRFIIHDESIQFIDSDGPRLIKRVTAKRADGSTFWTQVFYRSSGKSSHYNGVWFPFLGISIRRGAPYFTKGLPYPKSWPVKDRFQKHERISDKDSELIGRFGTRSFLLAANTFNALSNDPEHLDEIVTRIFEGVVPEAVDPKLQTIILGNTKYDNEKWDKLAATLPSASPEDVNKFIGSDIYINYGKEDGLDLSKIPIPDFFSMEGGRRSRRHKSKSRRKHTRCRRRR